jgi:serine/threonine protein kinase
MTVELASWIGLNLANGRYQVTAKLGEGGMGFVYRARDANLRTDVVIKVPRLGDDGDFAKRFEREIRSLVQLVHPHIVKVMDVGSHAGLPFVVMQFLQGGSLKDRQIMGRDGSPTPLGPDELRGWLKGVAEALDFIHAQRYIHRDVKPANVLFDQLGNAFLSDFGVAKAVAGLELHQAAALTGTGMVLGTAEYMAPELIMGQGVDGRVDQYALAVTAYEMLTGRVPFMGITPAAVLVRQTMETPVAPETIVPNLSKGISSAILRGLAKDPAARFANCGAFAQAVLEHVPRKTPSGKSAAAKPPSGAAVAAGQLVRLECPVCLVSLRLGTQHAGRRIRCLSCKEILRVEPDMTRLSVHLAPVERAVPKTRVEAGMAPPAQPVVEAEMFLLAAGSALRETDPAISSLPTGQFEIVGEPTAPGPAAVVDVEHTQTNWKTAAGLAGGLLLLLTFLFGFRDVPASRIAVPMAFPTAFLVAAMGLSLICRESPGGLQWRATVLKFAGALLVITLLVQPMANAKTDLPIRFLVIAGLGEGAALLLAFLILAIAAGKANLPLVSYELGALLIGGLVLGAGVVAVLIPETEALRLTGFEWQARLGFLALGATTTAMVAGQILRQQLSPQPKWMGPVLFGAAACVAGALALFLASLASDSLRLPGRSIETKAGKSSAGAGGNGQLDNAPTGGGAGDTAPNMGAPGSSVPKEAEDRIRPKEAGLVAWVLVIAGIACGLLIAIQAIGPIFLGRSLPPASWLGPGLAVEGFAVLLMVAWILVANGQSEFSIDVISRLVPVVILTGTALATFQMVRRGKSASVNWAALTVLWGLAAAGCWLLSEDVTRFIGYLKVSKP